MLLYNHRKGIRKKGGKTMDLLIVIASLTTAIINLITAVLQYKLAKQLREGD